MNDFYQQRMNGGAVFNGAVLIQANGEIGGTKHVFVKLVGAYKDSLTYPTFGGRLVNPFPGRAKLFAGDICEYTDGLGEGETGGATVKVLKSYEVAKATSAETDKTIYLVRDGFKHIPFVGDNIMVGAKDFETKGKGVAVTAVEPTTDSVAGDVWAVTLSEALGTLTKGTVLVEASAKGASVLPMVTNPNAYFPSDYDFAFDARTALNDYSKALYLVTPALASEAVKCYKSKMSPIPPALLALNKAKVKSWFCF